METRPRAQDSQTLPRAVEAKSNEITAIPELLGMLAIEGAIVTIDAIGTQEAIARTILAKKADYLLALKNNQGSLCADVADFFADPALASAYPQCRRIEAGHGRIEDRLARAADAAWLAERHPRWADLRSIVAISATRTDKKPARPRPRRSSLSPPCRPIRPCCSPLPGRIGASRTTCIGVSM